MEAFLPVFLAWAHQPYRKQFIKDHIEIKAYCKRDKKCSVYNFKIKEREHKAYFFEFKLIYTSCMLWPTKGQKERNRRRDVQREKASDRDAHGGKGEGESDKRVASIRPLLPKLQSRPLPPSGAPSPSTCWQIWWPPLLCFLKLPEALFFYFVKSQASPVLALLPIPVGFSVLGQHLLPWHCRPLVAGCSCRVFTAAFTLTPLPSSADLNFQPSAPKNPGDLHCVHYPSYPHPSHTDFPLISEDCYLWAKPHESWEPHSWLHM